MVLRGFFVEDTLSRLANSQIDNRNKNNPWEQIR
jgi:hypothetical protein